MKAFFKSIERPSWGIITAIVGSYTVGYIISFQNLADFSMLLTDDRLNWRQTSKSFCLTNLKELLLFPSPFLVKGKRCGHDLGGPLRHVL